MNVDLLQWQTVHGQACLIFGTNDLNEQKSGCGSREKIQDSQKVNSSGCHLEMADQAK
jgi:hypothetical protein